VTNARVDADRLPPDVRLLAPWYADQRPDDLAAHVRRHGPLPEAGAEELAELVDDAGLRGRGGSGFPTAVKLRAVAARRPRRLGSRRAVVVANGCEGEPASGKDAALLHCAPHLVLDGIAIAATGLGASEAILCVHEGSPGLEPLRRHASARHDPVPVRIETVSARYVASEESALVQYLNGGPPVPTTAPPRPAERGVGGAPTLVDNVETLAHLALIARHGPTWFRALGTPDLPGTLLVTIGGALRRPGVVEIAAGTPIGDVLDLACGPTEPVHAVLSGGYGGAWLGLHDPATLRTPLTHEALRAAGSVLGVPTLLALPARACGLAQTAHLLRYLAGESAGQCGPCRFGLPAVADDVAAIVHGTPEARRAHGRLARRLDLVAGRGACAHPDGAARLARSALRVFAQDLKQHLAGQPCRAAAGAPVFPMREPSIPHLPAQRARPGTGARSR
jgi:NADH:ubiquinone oxidoreductase subunit F (NADH-binding)